MYSIATCTVSHIFIQRQIMVCTENNLGLKVTHSYHIRLPTALSCAIFELFNLEECRDLARSLKIIGNDII